jgi:hypothetical protein
MCDREDQMRFKFPFFDGRSFHHLDIIDEDTGKKVGYIRSSGVRNGGGIHISMFGERYVGSVNEYKHCWGFVKGVEAVLKHMTSTEFMHEPRGYERLATPEEIEAHENSIGSLNPPKAEAP